MEQPGSPTPPDIPEDGEGIASEPQSDEANGSAGDSPMNADAPSPPSDAPNPNEDSATESSGGTDSADLLNQMYLDLGHLVAAHDLHREQAEQELKKLSVTAQNLQKQREEALQEGDHMKYANAVRGLNEVAKIADILQNDAEDELRAPPPQHQDLNGSADEPAGDGDAPGSGDGQPLADQARLGVGERGDGNPDGEVGGDDDPSGRDNGGGSLRPE